MKPSSTNIEPETRPNSERAHDAEARMRAVLASVLGNKQLRGQRSAVAAALTDSTGVKVTKQMLDDWCSTSKKGLRFPLSLTRAICEITGNDDLAFAAMTDDLRERAEIGTALRPYLLKWAEKKRRKAASKRSK